MPNLRVAHFPQIPCKPFHVDVNSVEDGVRMMHTLAQYDLFQLKHHIKPDFSNVSVLEMFDTDEQEWVSWFDETTGIDDPNEYLAFLEEVTNEKNVGAYTVNFALTGAYVMPSESENGARQAANDLIDDVIEDVERLVNASLKADDYTVDVVAP